MKAPLFATLLFLSLLSIACQSDANSLPTHAQEVREKHKQKDSLRSLEIIDRLQQEHLPDSLPPQQN